MMKIERGPFAGTQIPENELSVIYNHDGTTTDWWPVANRTPVFLEKFPPHEGWSIEVRREPGPFNLPDYRNAVGSEVTVQPTQLFVVVLLKDGVVVNQASSLEIIDGGKAWERGETNARGRLYEAMGLPGSTKPFLHQLLGDAKQPERPVSTAAGVTIIPIATPKPSTDAPAIAPTGVAPVDEAAPLPSAAATDAPVVSNAPVAPPASPEQPAQDTATPTTSRSTGSNTATPQSSSINANLLKQIEVQARIKGVDVPAFADNAAAKVFLRDLLTAKVA